VFVIGTKERPSLLHLEETCAALAAADQSRTEVDQVTCDAIRQRLAGATADWSNAGSFSMRVGTRRALPPELAEVQSERRAAEQL
jgi:hypothetical protein